MIAFIKRMIAERMIIKVFGFIFALGVIPILIFLYGLDDKPSWVSKTTHPLQHSYALTIKAPLNFTNIEKSKRILEENANIAFKKEIFDRAMKQLKLSYDWDNLDASTQQLIQKNLETAISSLSLKTLKKQSIYEDKLAFEIYGLYSMQSARIDMILQGIYENINQKILETIK